jgi:predicted nucleic acid-binding protein
LKSASNIGKLYLVDTSVMAHSDNTAVREIVVGLIADHAAATCGTLDMRAAYSARNHEELLTIAERRRSLYKTLPLTESVAERACEVQSRLAARGLHRASHVLSLMAAAVAEQHGAVMLHYNADFEVIAAVTGQAHLWVAPQGSLD